MLCAFLLISVCLLPWMPAYAADFKVVATNSGISIVSGEPIFGIANMAPGDRQLSTLVVENHSSQSFILAISADVTEGDGVFHGGLDITIPGIYSGPLSGLQMVELDTFVPGSKLSFPMEVSLPTAAGNQYQGLEVTVRFRITLLSSGPPGPEDPDLPAGPDPEKPDPGLPVTGTNIYWLLPLGLVLFLVGLLLLSSDRKEWK